MNTWTLSWIGHMNRMGDDRKAKHIVISQYEGVKKERKTEI
jgi:hypothetical protein